MPEEDSEKILFEVQRTDSCMAQLWKYSFMYEQLELIYQINRYYSVTTVSILIQQVNGKNSLRKINVAIVGLSVIFMEI